MKHLVIIGARGFGREVFGMAHRVESYMSGEMDIKGFLDDKADALDGLRCAWGEFPSILGPVETYVPEADDVFVCALGEAKYRRKYAEMILARGGKFVSLIDPKAIVSAAADIGPGSIIGAWTTISNNVTIGAFAMIHSFCTFGHDCRIGAYNSIESYCFFGGYSATGDETTMHVRSAIIPHKRVGNRVSVGFGSVVMRNFGDDVHLFGNPAKKMEF